MHPLARKLFALSPDIRYVAIYLHGRLGAPLEIGTAVRCVLTEDGLAPGSAA